MKPFHTELVECDAWVPPSTMHKLKLSSPQLILGCAYFSTLSDSEQKLRINQGAIVVQTEDALILQKASVAISNAGLASIVVLV